MISFIVALNKLKKGDILEKRLIKYLKSYLGYEFGICLAIPLIFIGILVILAIVFFAFNMYSLMYLFIFIVVFLFVLFIPFIPPLNRVIYNSALKGFLNKHLAFYKDMKLIYTSYKYNSNYKIDKERIYFFYDDYYFYIVEDLLIDDKFKYPDELSINKEAVRFKLSEVNSFIVNREQTYNLSSIKDLIKTKDLTDSYAKVDFTNFKSILIGYEVGLVLNEIVPYLNEY